MIRYNLDVHMMQFSGILDKFGCNLDEIYIDVIHMQLQCIFNAIEMLLRCNLDETWTQLRSN